MTMQNEVVSMPRKYPEIIRILIFAGILELLGIVTYPITWGWSCLGNEMIASGRYTADTLIYSIASVLEGWGLCIISGILARRFVFRSNKSAFLPILVTCGMKDVAWIITGIVGSLLMILEYQGRVTSQQHMNSYNLINYLLFSIAVPVLSYVVMRYGFYKKTLDTLVEPAKASAPVVTVSAEEQPEQA